MKMFSSYSTAEAMLELEKAVLASHLGTDLTASHIDSKTSDDGEVFVSASCMPPLLARH